LKAANGYGSIEKLPSGRFRVRLTLVDGTRKSLGPYDTQGEAEKCRDAALQLLAEGKLAPVGGITLRPFGRRWLEERELSGDIRGIRTELRAPKNTADQTD
jgi:hypothetical protein